MRFIIPILALCALAGPARGDETPRTVESILEDLKSEDATVRLKAAQDAATVTDGKLLRPLTKALKDDSDDVRLAAIAALAKRTDTTDRKKAASALLARVPRKGGATWAKERLAALDALHDLARPETIRPLLDGIDVAMEIDEVQARMTAVANVPHKDAIERLIQFLDSGRRGMAHQKGAANRALRYATGMKVNRNPDAWRAWWRANKKTFDFDAAMQARQDAERERQEKAAEAERKKEDKQRRKRERKKKKRQKEDEPKDDA